MYLYKIVVVLMFAFQYVTQMRENKLVIKIKNEKIKSCGGWF